MINVVKRKCLTCGALILPGSTRHSPFEVTTASALPLLGKLVRKVLRDCLYSVRMCNALKYNYPATIGVGRFEDVLKVKYYLFQTYLQNPRFSKRGQKISTPIHLRLLYKFTKCQSNGQFLNWYCSLDQVA